MSSHEPLVIRCEECDGTGTILEEDAGREYECPDCGGAGWIG